MATYEVQIVATTTVTRVIEIDAETPEAAREAALGEARSATCEFEWSAAGEREYSRCPIDPAALTAFSIDEVRLIAA